MFYSAFPKLKKFSTKLLKVDVNFPECFSSVSNKDIYFLKSKYSLELIVNQIIQADQYQD